MKGEPVVIIGSGGHAKVVIELIRAEGKYQIAGCTGLAGGGFVLDNVPILGTDSVLPAVLAANGASVEEAQMIDAAMAANPFALPCVVDVYFY